MGAVILKCPVCDGVGSVVDSDKVKEAIKETEKPTVVASNAIVKTKRKYNKKPGKVEQKKDSAYKDVTKD